jgi:hypothetical protein
MSLSLGEFVRGPDDGPSGGLGVGGNPMHAWLSETVSGYPDFDPSGLSGRVFAELVRSTSGHEANSARRVAEMVRDLAGLDDAPPLRLLLGADAVPMAPQATQELTANDEA